MGRVHIVTDSVSQIPPALRHELEIEVVPLPLVEGGKTYLDDEVEPREFYARLRTASVVPSTSGPTPGAFKEKFERLGADGQPILAILVGKQFSSTQNAAALARGMVPAVDVTIFDSGSNTMALGFMVLAAARAARAGKGLDDIVAMLRELKSSSGAVFAAPNISYLLRGGRINHLQHFLARTLDLVPIMELRGGPIRLIQRVRSERNVPEKLIALVSERLGSARPARTAVVHVDAETKAWQLSKEVEKRLAPDELIVSELTPVLGIHVGPDGLGIAYSSGA
ncbi:MAG: DegV family protein [Anaerolineales bacterium]